MVGTAVEEVVLASSGQKSGVPLATLRSTGRPLKTEEHPPPNVGRAEEGSSSAWSACERSFRQWTHPYESGSQNVTAALLSHKLHSRGILFGSHSLKNSCFLTVTGK